MNRETVVATEKDGEPVELEEIVAAIAHDLRTPLTALIQTLEVLRSGRAGQLNEAQERFVALGRRSSGELLELVDSLQEHSLLRTGRLRVRFRPVDAGEALRSVADTLTPLAETRGQRLRCVAPADCGVLWADPALVRRALVNLLGNALKFAPRGGNVEVSAEPSDGGARVAHAVQDDGPGIPAEERARIFDRYHRTSRTARRPGCGIGLSVVRDIVLAHAGRVVVLGNGTRPGTTFRVGWPAFGSGLAAEAQLRAALNRPGAGHQRLAVLDASDASDAKALHAWHAEVVAVLGESGDAGETGEIVDLGGGALGVLLVDACARESGSRAVEVVEARLGAGLAPRVRATFCTAGAQHDAAALLAAARSAVARAGPRLARRA